MSVRISVTVSAQCCADKPALGRDACTWCWSKVVVGVLINHACPSKILADMITHLSLSLNGSGSTAARLITLSSVCPGFK